MREIRSPDPTPADIRRGYEGNNITIRGALIFLGIFTLFLASSMVAMWFLFTGLSTVMGDTLDSAYPPPLVGNYEAPRPPPNLQPSPGHPRVPWVDMAIMKDQQEAMLADAGVGWRWQLEDEAQYNRRLEVWKADVANAEKHKHAPPPQPERGRMAVHDVNSWQPAMLENAGKFVSANHAPAPATQPTVQAVGTEPTGSNRSDHGAAGHVAPSAVGQPAGGVVPPGGATTGPATQPAGAPPTDQGPKEQPQPQRSAQGAAPAGAEGGNPPAAQPQPQPENKPAENKPETEKPAEEKPPAEKPADPGATPPPPPAGQQ